jgi:hypothetical protein
MLDIKNCAITSILLLAITGCGGSSSEEPPTPAPTAPTVQTGIFVDSAVYGIGYRTESGDGFTNKEGEFNYISGDTVTFFIGNFDFPSATASSVVTILDIANTDDYNDNRVRNIARLLQTLDKDGNPDNGIEITDAAHENASVVDLTIPTEDFEAAQEVIDFITNGGQDVVQTSLIPLSQAILHLSEQIEKYNNIALGAPGTVVGSWTLTDTPALEGEPGVVNLILTEQGNYYFLEWDNPDHGSDFEYGSYSYSNRKLTFTAIENQNDNIGPTNSEDSSSWELIGTEDEDGNAVFAFELEGEVGFVEFTQNNYDNKGLSGVWQPTDGDNNATDNVIVFDENSEGSESIYIVMTPDGYELGNYMYDTSTETLRFYSKASISSIGLMTEVLNIRANTSFAAKVDAATKQLTISTPKYNSYKGEYDWVETPRVVDASLADPYCSGIPASVSRKASVTITVEHHPEGFNQLTELVLNFSQNPIQDTASTYSFDFGSSASAETAVNENYSIYLGLSDHVTTNNGPDGSTQFEGSSGKWDEGNQCWEHISVTATETSLTEVIYNGFGRANRIDNF